MEEANIAGRLEDPVWMNEDNVEYEEGEAFGCKVIHRITHLDSALCVDEVGVHTCQKGDGVIGGEEFVCTSGTSSKEKVSTKANHWTLLGMTVFDGSPVVCVVIFAGKQKVPLYKIGMDQFANIKGTSAKKDFFYNNSGPRKLYSGGTKCTYKEMGRLACVSGPPRAVLIQLS